MSEDASRAIKSIKERGRRAKRSARPPGQVATERVGQRQRLLSQQPVGDTGAAAAGGGAALLAVASRLVEITADIVRVVRSVRQAKKGCES